MNISILAAGLLVALGDVLFVIWARQGQPLAFVIGLLLNIAGILCYAQSMRTLSAGVATTVYLGLNIVLVSIAGLTLGDHIKASGLLGMAAVAVGIVLLQV
ncbi:MAG: hypothetical protein V1725_02210 [archaeon]